MALPLLRILATGLIALGTLFAIVGLATTSWGRVEGDGLEARWGLWQICISKSSNVYCTALTGEGVTSELEATRAFVILSVLTGLGAVSLSVALIVARSLASNKVVNLAAAILGFTSGVMALIAIIIFATKTKSDPNFASSGMKYGYSFILTIIGGVMCIAGGFASLVAMKQTQYSSLD